MTYTMTKEYMEICKKNGIEPTQQGAEKYRLLIKSHKKIKKEVITQ